MKNEPMTEKQRAAIHFKLYGLPGWGDKDGEFVPLYDMNADQEFTKKEASDLIDCLIAIIESKKGSPTYEKCLGLVRNLMFYHQHLEKQP